MENVKELVIGLITECFPKKMIKFVLAIILLGVGLYFFFSSEYYINHYKVPKWNYRSENDSDIFEADISLKTGYIVVTPQIIVKFDEKVIFIIDILSYYEVNATELRENAEGKKCYFELFATADQVQEYNECFKKVKQAITERLEHKDKIEFQEVKLVKIESQNTEANTGRCQYLYITDSVEKEIQEKEALLRRTIYSIDLDCYKEDGRLNEDANELIETCVEKILNLD